MIRVGLAGLASGAPLLASGHDGRFFFARAIEPLDLGDTSNARYLDWELYRSQRISSHFRRLALGRRSCPRASQPDQRALRLTGL